MSDERSGRERLTLGARRLPDVTLAAVPGGAPEPLRPRGRTAPLVVAVHAADCAECLAYLRALAEESEEIAAWDGRVRVVVPASPEAAAAVRDALSPAFAVLADPERVLEARTGIEGAAVIVADQYGEIHDVRGAGAGHDLPSPAEVAGWARYLAVQCPECQGEAL
jgi:peroxiredoxin